MTFLVIFYWECNTQLVTMSATVILTHTKVISSDIISNDWLADCDRIIVHLKQSDTIIETVVITNVIDVYYIRFKILYSNLTPLMNIEFIIEHFGYGKNGLKAIFPLFDSNETLYKTINTTMYHIGMDILDNYISSYNLSISISEREYQFCNKTKIFDSHMIFYEESKLMAPFPKECECIDLRSKSKLIQLNKENGKCIFFESNNPLITIEMVENHIFCGDLEELIKEEVALITNHSITSNLTDDMKILIMKYRKWLLKNYLKETSRLVMECCLNYSIKYREQYFIDDCIQTLLNDPTQITFLEFIKFTHNDLLNISQLLFTKILTQDIFNNAYLLIVYLLKCTCINENVIQHLHQICYQYPNKPFLHDVLWRLFSLRNSNEINFVKLFALFSNLHQQLFPLDRYPQPFDVTNLLHYLNNKEMSPIHILQPFCCSPIATVVSQTIHKSFEKPLIVQFRYKDNTTSSILVKKKATSMEEEMMCMFSSVSSFCGSYKTFRIITLDNYKLVEMVDSVIQVNKNEHKFERLLNVQIPEGLNEVHIVKDDRIYQEINEILNNEFNSDIALLSSTQRINNFVESTAMAHLFTYMFAIQDRHPKNVLFCWKTGHLFHVDLTFFDSFVMMLVRPQKLLSSCSGETTLKRIGKFDEMKNFSIEYMKRVVEWRDELSCLLMLLGGTDKLAKQFVIDSLYRNDVVQQMQNCWENSTSSNLKNKFSGFTVNFSFLTKFYSSKPK
ncbi:PI3K/PI4K catalytic domain-containing protein [Entamoeba marina]